MSKVNQNITVSEKEQALEILRVFYGSFKRTVSFYEKESASKNAENSAKWNKHRMDDCVVLANLIKRIDAINDTPNNEECPF